MNPRSSWSNEVSLNPDETSDFAPKLEFEPVRDISPPVSVTKCSAKPTAKHDTA